MQKNRSPLRGTFPTKRNHPGNTTSNNDTCRVLHRARRVHVTLALEKLARLWSVVISDRWTWGTVQKAESDKRSPRYRRNYLPTTLHGHGSGECLIRGDGINKVICGSRRSSSGAGPFDESALSSRTVVRGPVEQGPRTARRGPRSVCFAD